MHELITTVPHWHCGRVRCANDRRDAPNGALRAYREIRRRHPWRAAESGSGDAPASGTNGSGKHSPRGNASSVSGSASAWPLSRARPDRRPDHRVCRRGTPAATPRPPSSSASASASASATATTSAAAVNEPATHCTYTSSGIRGQPDSLPPASPDYKAAYTATINTNLGKIVINLLNSKATCTVNSFVHLATDQLLEQHPVPPGVRSDGLYMLQCGDPTAAASQKLSCSSPTTLGTGGPGYSFADENLTGATL